MNDNYFDRWIDGMFGAIGATNTTPKNYTITVKRQNFNAAPSFEIQSVLSNRKKNAFTVVWADGTSTVVHCQPGDDWDDEKALAMCFTKKALGNKGNFNNKFNDALDNKRKIIPGGAGIIAENTSGASISFTRPITLNEEAVKKMIEAPEKACDCDSTCKECKCDYDHINISGSVCECECEKERARITETQKAIEKMKKSANIATSSFKEMIEELVGETTPRLDGHYKVYIRIGGRGNGESHLDSEFTSIPALRKRVHEIAEELYGRKPYYYRTWMNGNRMIIDFGHYTQFIEVEGITPDKYAKH